MNGWLYVAALLLAAILLTGCATVHGNPCSMSNMTAAQIERSLVEGCG